jgi:hypothetical protein
LSRALRRRHRERLAHAVRASGFNAQSEQACEGICAQVFRAGCRHPIIAKRR